MKRSVKKAVLLLAHAYTQARAGNSVSAGKYLVRAVTEGDLDPVMDGIAEGMDSSEDANMEEDDFTNMSASSEFDDMEDDMSEDDMDDSEDEVKVEVPASVYRFMQKHDHILD